MNDIEIWWCEKVTEASDEELCAFRDANYLGLADAGLTPCVSIVHEEMQRRGIESRVSDRNKKTAAAKIVAAIGTNRTRSERLRSAKKKTRTGQ